MQIQSLGSRVFDCSFAHLNSNESLPYVVAGTASFEDWFTAEISVGLIRRGFACSGRPKFGGQRKFGDLDVSLGDQRLMLEIKIISDQTLDKYRDAIDGDYDKLADLCKDADDGQEGMLLAILYSTKKLDRPSWTPWLQEMRHWSKQKESRTMPIGPAGELRLCAWYLPESN